MPGLLVFHSFVKRSHLLPDQLPSEHTGDLYSHFCFKVMTWKNAQCFCICLIAPPTILQSGRSMVVGHVPKVHTCSFMCTNHINMTAHTLAFLPVGKHSGVVAFSCALVLSLVRFELSITLNEISSRSMEFIFKYLNNFLPLSKMM